MKNSKHGPKIFATFVLLAMVLPLIFGLIQGYEVYTQSNREPEQDQEIIDENYTEDQPFDMYRDPEDESYEEDIN